MTRKKAIEIVVANVKMGWPYPGWTEATISKRGLHFFLHSCVNIKPKRFQDRWDIPHKWLKDEGHIIKKNK